MFRKLVVSGVVAIGLICQTGASAQTKWPDKPVRVIVPNAAGSGPDIGARLLSDALSKVYGQSFIVDNKPGANGMIAAEAVAKAANDGYNLLFTYASAQVVNPLLYANAKYDAAKDFEAIVQIGAGGNLLVVPTSLPVNNLKEFIAYAKSKPANSLSYGSWGYGSGGHLSMEALKQQTGLEILHVPYKTATASSTDLIGGQIQVSFTSIASSLPLIQAGKLKAIAVSGPYRVPQLPDVKTMTEQGVKFDLVAWYGLFAPAGTAPSIVNSINHAVIEQLQKPDVVAKWKASLGLSEIPIKTPEQFAQTVRDDIRDWGAIVKAANIKIE